MTYFPLFLFGGTVLAVVSVFVSLFFMRQNIEGRVKSVTYSTAEVASEYYIVYFDDGRNKMFYGIPEKPITVGKYYQFSYNAFGIACDIKEQFQLELFPLDD